MSNPKIILHSPTGVIRVLFDVSSTLASPAFSQNSTSPTRNLPTHSQGQWSQIPQEWVILPNSTSKDLMKSKRGVMDLEPVCDRISNDGEDTEAGAARDEGERWLWRVREREGLGMGVYFLLVRTHISPYEWVGLSRRKNRKEKALFERSTIQHQHLTFNSQEQRDFGNTSLRLHALYRIDEKECQDMKELRAWVFRIHRQLQGTSDWPKAIWLTTSRPPLPHNLLPTIYTPLYSLQPAESTRPLKSSNTDPKPQPG